MNHRRSTRSREAIRAVCETIESRTYLTVTFASPTATSLSGVTSPIVTAQFDTQSDFADLATATPGSVKILLGNTFGTFTVSDSIPFPANPAAQTPFLVGNFSGNGSDIVLLSQDSSTHNGVITYETSQGDGTFTALGTSVITNNGHGFDPIAGAVADFNSDSNDDLAILGKPSTGHSLVLAIMLSNGDGTFTEAQDYNVTGSNLAGSLDNNTVLTASLDGGPPDVILYDGSGGNLDVFMGAGDGSFTQLTPVPLTATQLITDTFTSSGFPDVIAADGTQLTPLLGNGDGTFTPQSPITLGGTVSSLASADMDLDGNPDLITNLGVLSGNGDGTFQDPVALPIAEGGSTFSSNIIPVDLDGDGRPDLVGISSNGNALLSVQNITPTSSSVSVSSSENPASPGDDVQFTATVSSSLSLKATGQVDFLDGTTMLGSAQLQSDGTATLDAGTALSPGSHSITAEYEGDSNFFASTSDPFTQSILFPTTTAVTSSANPSGSGAAVTFTAIVTGNDGNGDVPSGNVEFFDDTTDLGGGTLDANGDTTLDDTQLSGGVHGITAEYQADSNYAASTSAVFEQTVAFLPLSPVVKSTTLPSSIVAGAPVHGIATVELTNTTQSTISGPTTITLFASTDGNVSGATQLVALPARNLTVLAGQTLPVKVSIPSLPASLGDGSYMLIAQATYNSGTVSASSTGPTIQIAAAFTSLAETFSSVKLPSPVVSGTSIVGSLKVLITNNGNAPSKGPTSFSLSLSPEQDQPGTTIPALTRSLAIKPDGSQTVVLTIRSIPSGLTGDYFFVLQVTDPNGNPSVASTDTPISIAAPVVALSAKLGTVTNVNNGDTVTITNTGNIDDVTSLTSSIGFSHDSAGAQPVAGSTVVLGSPIQIKPGKRVKLHLTQWTSLLSALTPGSRYFLTVTVTDQNGVSASAVSPTAFTD